MYVKYWAQTPRLQNGYEDIVITERLGGNKFLFNYYNFEWQSDGDYVFEHLCYRDNEFGLKQLTDRGCVYYSGLKNYEANKLNIRLSPNPTADYITLIDEDAQLSEFSKIMITDITGKHVRELPAFHAISGKIDLKDLKSGLYLVKIMDNNNLVYAGKLLKID